MGEEPTAGCIKLHDESFITVTTCQIINVVTVGSAAAIVVIICVVPVLAVVVAAAADK
jgi:hypothetical protein